MKLNINKLLLTTSLVFSSFIIIGCDTAPTTFNVVFKNYDDSILYSTSVVKNETAVYGGETPTKPSDEQYQYVFDGWDKSLENIEADTTFVAQYVKTNDYVVNFYNDDGTTLLLRKYVKSGDSVTYDGETPTKAATYDYRYSFKGWDKSFENITSNLDVKATYDEGSNIDSFTINFDFEVDQGATVFDKDTTNYLGKDKGEIVYLKEPVIEDGKKHTNHRVTYDEMTFDYSQVDTNAFDEFNITITYGGIVKNDVIDAIPDVSTWTNDVHYNFSARTEETGPEWWEIVYLDIYDQGVMLNAVPGEFISDEIYHLEVLDEGNTLRFYGKRDGASTDVIYNFDGEYLSQYDFGKDRVDSLHCVIDGGEKDLGPDEFDLLIYQTLDQATSAYGTVPWEGTYVNAYLTAKYDYDATNKSLKIHLPGYPNPFVYNESDNAYHTQK